ncbi:hypothetical protein PLICRDRAFT_611136 [Plicaturopsis crispa FD-325 SS-3]|nr:hypothetical protein PLICRDRAFT_611136 [Plicaturopsis crispa FD-325 SS-3]
MDAECAAGQHGIGGRVGLSLLLLSRCGSVPHLSLVLGVFLSVLTTGDCAEVYDSDYRQCLYGTIQQCYILCIWMCIVFPSKASLFKRSESESTGAANVTVR